MKPARDTERAEPLTVKPSCACPAGPRGQRGPRGAPGPAGPPGKSRIGFMFVFLCFICNCGIIFCYPCLVDEDQKMKIALYQSYWNSYCRLKRSAMSLSLKSHPKDYQSQGEIHRPTSTSREVSRASIESLVQKTITRNLHMQIRLFNRILCSVQIQIGILIWSPIPKLTELNINSLDHISMPI